MISRKKLVEFGVNHDDAAGPLDRWYRVAKRATWANFTELRGDFPAADLVEDFVVFNVGGNKYRLISDIYFEDQVLLVRHVLTHHEYDKEAWKKRPTD